VSDNRITSRRSISWRGHPPVSCFFGSGSLFALVVKTTKFSSHYYEFRARACSSATSLDSGSLRRYSGCTLVEASIGRYRAVLVVSPRDSAFLSSFPRPVSCRPRGHRRAVDGGRCLFTSAANILFDGRRIRDNTPPHATGQCRPLGPLSSQLGPVYYDQGAIASVILPPFLSAPRSPPPHHERSPPRRSS